MSTPRRTPQIYSIAAHRGFADALVAGLVPRYAEAELGLARLTLLVPSMRAARTISEAFVRHAGEAGSGAQTGLLMPRMITIGDLDLDEALGSLLDPLGSEQILPAIEPSQRWFELAGLIAKELAEEGADPLPGAQLLRLARGFARTIDRLLVEEKTPRDLTGDAVLDQLGAISGHYQRSIRLFARVQARWLDRLAEVHKVDAATRRNLLFDRAAERWRKAPPEVPIIAAGVTSAAPALARLLRVISELPQGAVILPDVDLSMSPDAWDELGQAGTVAEPGDMTFGTREALTHPQYHLKLLLQRMGVARGELRPWHRKGLSAAPPARSRAISALFLPPEASKCWVDLPTDQRSLNGVQLLTSATIEEEAQALSLLVRRALDEPGKRIAVVTADRSLARRIVQQLARWNIAADDSAGRPLSLTPAGRLFGLVAELASSGPEPINLIAALAHPVVRSQTPEMRRSWLSHLRRFERALRGPAPAPGMAALREVALKAGVGDWWEEVETLLAPILLDNAEQAFADMLDHVSTVGQALASDTIWAREDGRALAAMVEDLRLHARETETLLAPSELSRVLRETMDEIAVRPPYGGHPRVAIYGLLEARMARADLVLCAGLNEGSWPQAPAPDPVLAPAILRALGVPAGEFRIGLAAHDLAGAMGAPQVVLSRALRDTEGPALPSRFWLRVEALLGEELADRHREKEIAALAARIDRTPHAPPPDYPRPTPRPSAEQRQVPIKVTALDRLLGDPYQFYAQEILGLNRLDPLAADPFSDPALRGVLMHEILDAWHRVTANEPDIKLVPFAETILRDRQVHPLFRGLWQPRLMAGLARFEQWVKEDAAQGRKVLATEISGAMRFAGIKVYGRADRIDRLADGTLAVVDYKTGKPPCAAQVKAGYALQLGLLGLIAGQSGFEQEGRSIGGEATQFEYWSLAKQEGEFGYRDEPLKTGRKKTGLLPEKFLPHHAAKLTLAIERYIAGTAPFMAKENPNYPGYSDYDQLMRLEEWAIRLAATSDQEPGP
ncbi:MAG: double-strand break repair protein AddB [Pseudomonadota bacterium]